MNDRKKPKISKVNDRSLYGKTPLESWVGTVVSYDAQKEQIEGGWGWRYKVRIMGDNTQSDTITDDKLDYAYCLLPTTAGSGGAYKLRSVRVSQGDFVYGVKGGGGPLMILAVYPRTSKQVSGDGHFKNLSGFTGSLKNTGILDGEFNEQIGPTTPGASGLSPKEWTKATAKNPSEKVKEIVPQVKKQENGEFEEVSEELTEKNDVKKNAGKVVDPLKWEPGTPLNTATMEALKEDFDNGTIPPETWEAALKQASEQGLDGYEEYVVKDQIKEEVIPKKVDYKQKITNKINEKGAFDEWERSVLTADNNKGKITFRNDGRLGVNVVTSFRIEERQNILKEINRLEKSIQFDSEFEGTTISTEDSTGVKTYNIPKPSQTQIQLDIRKLRHLTTQLSYIENGGSVRNNDNSLNEEWAKVKYTDEFPNG